MGIIDAMNKTDTYYIPAGVSKPEKINREIYDILDTLIHKLTVRKLYYKGNLVGYRYGDSDTVGDISLQSIKNYKYLIEVLNLLCDDDYNLSLYVSGEYLVTSPDDNLPTIPGQIAKNIISTIASIPMLTLMDKTISASDASTRQEFHAYIPIKYLPQPTYVGTYTYKEVVLLSKLGVQLKNGTIVGNTLTIKNINQNVMKVGDYCLLCDDTTNHYYECVGADRFHTYILEIPITTKAFTTAFISIITMTRYGWDEQYLQADNPKHQFDMRGPIRFYGSATLKACILYLNDIQVRDNFYNSYDYDDYNDYDIGISIEKAKWLPENVRLSLSERIERLSDIKALKKHQLEMATYPKIPIKPWSGSTKKGCIIDWVGKRYAFQVFEEDVYSEEDVSNYWASIGDLFLSDIKQVGVMKNIFNQTEACVNIFKAYVDPSGFTLIDLRLRNGKGTTILYHEYPVTKVVDNTGKC